MSQSGRAALALLLGAINTALLFMAMRYEVWNGIYLGVAYIGTMIAIFAIAGEGDDKGDGNGSDT